MMVVVNVFRNGRGTFYRVRNFSSKLKAVLLPFKNLHHYIRVFLLFKMSFIFLYLIFIP